MFNVISIHYVLLYRDAILPLFLNFFAIRQVQKSQTIDNELDTEASMLLGKNMNTTKKNTVTIKC